jgi:quinol monooxygenase YgiN
VVSWRYRLGEEKGRMYVVVARYYTKEGKENEVLAILKQVVPLSRAEAGNRAYIVNQSKDDPRQMLLYEQYVDEDAFMFHAGREEFAELVKGQIWPLLESRVREIYTTVEPDEAAVQR